MEIVAVIEQAGGVSRLARETGVHHTAVIAWRRQGRLPVKRAQQIHDFYGIPLHELRPDIWAPPALEHAA